MYPSYVKKAAKDLYLADNDVKTVSKMLLVSVPSIYLWLRQQKVTLRSVPNWGKYRMVVRQRNVATFKLARKTGEL